MTALLREVAASWPVTVVLAFLALYPVITAAVWVITSLLYARRREGTTQADDAFYDIPDGELPRVSVLVPAYREQAGLERTLEALHVLDYPDYEVLVVDDGSPDGTADVARRHVAQDPRFRLLRKVVNEGKAMAMNDALPLLTGEVVLIVDADARLRPEALRALAAHFVRLPRVAGVTGNPRVANRTTLLAELQTLEFTAIVSLRRAQVVWGRVLTVSGVISAFRVSALRDVGGFDPATATEDIDVTWRLQRRFYDIRYEPRALVDMTVPVALRDRALAPALPLGSRPGPGAASPPPRRHRVEGAPAVADLHRGLPVDPVGARARRHGRVLGAVSHLRRPTARSVAVPERLGDGGRHRLPRPARHRSHPGRPLRPGRAAGLLAGSDLPARLLDAHVGGDRAVNASHAAAPPAGRCPLVQRSGGGPTVGAAVCGGRARACAGPNAASLGPGRANPRAVPSASYSVGADRAARVARPEAV